VSQGISSSRHEKPVRLCLAEVLFQLLQSGRPQKLHVVFRNPLVGISSEQHGNSFMLHLRQCRWEEGPKFFAQNQNKPSSKLCSRHSLRFLQQCWSWGSRLFCFVLRLFASRMLSKNN